MMVVVLLWQDLERMVCKSPLVLVKNSKFLAIRLVACHSIGILKERMWGIFFRIWVMIRWKYFRLRISCRSWGGSNRMLRDWRSCKIGLKAHSHTINQRPDSKLPMYHPIPIDQISNHIILIIVASNLVWGAGVVWQGLHLIIWKFENVNIIYFHSKRPN